MVQTADLSWPFQYGFAGMMIVVAGPAQGCTSTASLGHHKLDHRLLLCAVNKQASDGVSVLILPEHAWIQSEYKTLRPAAGVFLQNLGGLWCSV